MTRSRPTALLGLAAMAPAMARAPPLGVAAAATAVLIGVAAVDTMTLHHAADR